MSRFVLLQAVAQQIDPSLLGGGQARVPGPATGATVLDASQWAQNTASGLVHSTGMLIVLLVAVLGVGVAVGIALLRLFDGRSAAKNKPRWPRDWPKAKEIFTKDWDPTKPGYLSFEYEQGMGTGAMPLGRTYPRFSLFPDMYPFREWRRRVQYWTSRPVWVPPMKRLQHFAVLGATGKGKSTSYAIPILALGALEKDSAYFAIDVKSPQFVRMFARLYRAAGKDVFFVDPWSPNETLAFEPLWRANDERKDIIADVIATYSLEPGQVTESGNSEFFKVAATRLLRGVIELTAFWPRRYVNLPCVQQLIGSGGNVLKEAFEKAPDLLPTLDELLAAVEHILPLSAEELRRAPRDELTEGALAVVDRSGYRLAFMIKRMRRYEAAFRAQRPIERPEGGKAPLTEAEMAEIRKAFWSQVKHEWLERKQRLDALVMNQGEFINQPEDTRNSIVSTLTNKVAWFRDPQIARVFSRDEIDVRTLIERPCLFLVGAPMAKLRVGSLFVSALLSNLCLNAVFQRGMSIEKGERGVSKHKIYFLLDEFPQLQIKDAPSILATFRGFLSGLIMIFQERGQLKQLYGENATTMEANTVHKVLMTGAHEETAEFYATKAIGEVAITKTSESGVVGEKKSVSKSVEMMPLMSTQDVKAGRLNGRVMPGLALSVGSDVPAFPLRPIPFYEDPTLRKLLGLKRRVIKKGYEGRETWKFWQWSERWEPTSEGAEYLVRRKRKTPAERVAGVADPVHARLSDPYTQYLDYLLGDARQVFDELVEPRLVLADIGVTENDPRAAAIAAANRTSQRPGQPVQPATQGRPGAAPAALPPAMLVPVYGADFRALINDDFQSLETVPLRPVAGGPIDERIGSDTDALDDDFDLDDSAAA